MHIYCRKLTACNRAAGQREEAEEGPQGDARRVARVRDGLCGLLSTLFCCYYLKDGSQAHHVYSCYNLSLVNIQQWQDCGRIVDTGHYKDRLLSTIPV